MEAQQQLPTTFTPTKGGFLLRRRELEEFMRRVAPHAGFRMSADDIIGASSYAGLTTVRRRGQPRLVTLSLEVQYKWAEEQLCYAALNAGVFYSRQTTTTVYAHGSVHGVRNQSDPGPHLRVPGDSSYSCPATTNTNDSIPDFDYGSFVSSSVAYSGALPNTASLRDSADAAVQPDGGVASAVVARWLQNVPPPSTSFSQGLGYWGPDDSSGLGVYRYDYRWRLEGPYRLKIQWEQGGGSHELSMSAPGVSDWYSDTLPTLADVANRDAITAVFLTRL